MKDKKYSLPAAILLGNMGKKEALPVLLDGAKSTGSYSNLDNFLIDPLIKIGKPAVDEIEKLLSYPNSGTRLLAAGVMAKAGGKEELAQIWKFYLESFEKYKESYFLSECARILLEVGENPFPPYIEWLKKSNFDKESVSGVQYLFQGWKKVDSHLRDVLKKDTDEDNVLDCITVLLINQRPCALAAVREYRASVASEKMKERIDLLIKKYANKSR